MITVVEVTDELRRIRLVNRLKDRGISRITDGRYVDELTLDELWSEWKKVNIREQQDKIRRY